MPTSEDPTAQPSAAPAGVIDLRTWARGGERPGGEPRPWPEVLRVFRQIGRALAARHAGGNDFAPFSPDAVVVDPEGNATLLENPTAGKSKQGEAPPARIDLPYLAPELVDGDGERTVSDVRTDLYALCVAFYEALHGVRPFEGDTPSTSLASKRRGEPRPADPEVFVPHWIDAALRAGFAPDPKDRPVTVEAFLQALDDGEQARQRRATWLAIVVMVFAIIVAIVATQLDRRHRITQCHAKGAAIADVWNEDVAERLRATPGVEAPMLTRVDQFAARWRELTIDLCLEATVEQSLAAASYAAASQCLERRRTALEQLVEALSGGKTDAAFPQQLDACRTATPDAPSG